jgi:hypothetical protein
MRKKLMSLALAVVLTMTMSMSAFASPPTPTAPMTATSDVTTITGTGTVLYTDLTEYSILLPTQEAFNFIVDPQGLYNIATGDANAVAIDDLDGGRIIGQKPEQFINNSTDPIKLSIAARMTGDAATADTMAAVHNAATPTALLLLTPSVNNIRTTGDSFTFAGTPQGIVLGTDTTTLDFILPKATYNVKTNNATDFEITLVPNTGSGSALKIDGFAAKNADWSSFASGADDIGIELVFSFVVDRTEYLPNAYFSVGTPATPAFGLLQTTPVFRTLAPMPPPPGRAVVSRAAWEPGNAVGNSITVQLVGTDAVPSLANSNIAWTRTSPSNGAFNSASHVPNFWTYNAATKTLTLNPAFFGLSDLTGNVVVTFRDSNNAVLATATIPRT